VDPANLQVVFTIHPADFEAAGWDVTGPSVGPPRSDQGPQI
jgi:hypothetical protein